MKLPFRRRNEVEETELQVPSEVQEYYQAERRERAGVAWLLGLGTLAVTILLAVGLFFGGRWIYRKVTNNDRPTTANTTNVNQPATENTPKPPETSSTNTNRSASPPAAPVTPTPSPNTNSSAPSSPSTPTPSPTPAPSAQPGGRGQGGSDLPNTGPEHVIAISVATTLLGGLAHEAFIRHRTTHKN